jgi:E3 ubiquitin-protein ligase RBX1
MDFEIKKIEGVAFWKWNLKTDTCAICRNEIMEPCIQCNTSNSANDIESCTFITGICNHTYHLHCIEKWIARRNVCPLCNKEWVIDSLQ